MKKTAKANAKINLYLNVCGKREDGYHEIETVMQEISLCDEVSVEIIENKLGGNRIKLSSNDSRVPLNEKNIAYKCTAKFLEFTKKTGLDVHIHIEKRIPISGGLAGGSTDGAAVLKLLNDMTEPKLSESELCSIGVKAGADIPFCIVGGCCVCRGIGEKITKLSLCKPKYHVLIAPSGVGVSTPEAYGMIDSAELTSPCTAEDVVRDLAEGMIPSVLYNSFESVILPIRPAADKIKGMLLSLGADGVMMSGSGPTIFALFYDETKLKDAQRAMSGAGIKTYACDALI